MEWLDAQHPEYVDRLAGLVAAGPDRDRRRAVLRADPDDDSLARPRRPDHAPTREWLERRLGAKVRGMWMPERVWEQSLTSDLADAGIEYTVLDDFHFKNAGLDRRAARTATTSPRTTAGCCRCFPAASGCGTLIPFAAPQETIDYLRGIAEQQPGAVVVFGDDGEKFGTWPDTQEARLRPTAGCAQFFDALRPNSDWLKLDHADRGDRQRAAAGQDLPARRQLPRDDRVGAAGRAAQSSTSTSVHELEHDARWPQIKPFVRGGFWRNFKVKYPETNEMYARMHDGQPPPARRSPRRAPTASSIDQARTGALPRPVQLQLLARRVRRHLPAAPAQRRLQPPDRRRQPARPGRPGTHASRGSKRRPATSTSTPARKCGWPTTSWSRCSPRRAAGSSTSSTCGRSATTCWPRSPGGPRRITARCWPGPTAATATCASIHDRVVFKQAGLDQRLQYDRYPRKSCSITSSTTTSTLGSGRPRPGAGAGRLSCTASTKPSSAATPDRVQVQLTREGNAWGVPLKITKGVTLEAGSATLEIAYLLEDLPPDRPLHFGVEFNFAGLPVGADDRYFYDGQRRAAGPARHAARPATASRSWA